MKASEKIGEITVLQEHILRTLLYFDIFSYPLKSSEILQFAGGNCADRNLFQTNIETLVDRQLIFHFDEFFSLQNNQSQIKRRLKGNQLAKESIIIAYKQAAVIAKFPFVKGVFLSGSISKDYMDENSDLDFFIITQPGRLWVARALLILYKRIFLGNSNKHFCVNYFIDSDHLEIAEQNIFTATELATLVPLVNYGLYMQMMMDNNWIKSYFPNLQPRSSQNVMPDNKSFRKRVQELALTPFSPLLDNLSMKIFKRHWAAVYKKDTADKDFNIAFKSDKHVSKHHPLYYQQKVLEKYQQKIMEFSKNNDMGWHN
jgi:hypothetical protein